MKGERGELGDGGAGKDEMEATGAKKDVSDPSAETDPPFSIEINSLHEKGRPGSEEYWEKPV